MRRNWSWVGWPPAMAFLGSSLSACRLRMRESSFRPWFVGNFAVHREVLMWLKMAWDVNIKVYTGSWVKRWEIWDSLLLNFHTTLALLIMSMSRIHRVVENENWLQFTGYREHKTCLHKARAVLSVKPEVFATTCTSLVCAYIMNPCCLCRTFRIHWPLICWKRSLPFRCNKLGSCYTNHWTPLVS